MKDRLAGTNAAAYGVLVMLRSHDDQLEICREFAGAIRDAMNDCAAFCDSHGLMVSCVSSPSTISNDLARMANANGAGRKKDRPERIFLDLVGRADLLHPSA